MRNLAVVTWLWAALSANLPFAAAQDGQTWYATHPPMAHIKNVNQDTHQIVDEYGRTRFFHGTNVVMKEPPWYRPMDWIAGTSTFGPDDVRNMHDLGINIVRLGHHWAGAEPTRGIYNQTFIDIMKQQTKLAEEAGIYVLVDVHQDKLARQLCGQGVPDWFVQPDWVSPLKKFPLPIKWPFSVDKDGFPSPTTQCDVKNWALFYGTFATENAFGRLYNNYDGLGDAFASYWKKLASEYVDTPNIVGYNLLNEPWAGDAYADPTLLIPGVADRKVLEGLWNRAAKQIRTVDNDTLIWFEGVTFDVLSGFNNVPLGDGSKTVHSYHYYNPPQIRSISQTLENRHQDNVRLRTAGVLTELTFWGDDEDKNKALAEAMKATDENMVSWIGWAYENLYDSAGKPQPQLEKHYRRAYPAAVAGTPSSFSFDLDSGIFNLQFKAEPTIDAPTEIILPAKTFPNGYNVEVSPEGSMVQYKRDERTLALFTSTSLANATDVQIRISRKLLTS